MNGGYLMVSKSDTNLYTKLNNALSVGKPILLYEDENTCYYIDTITKSGTDIILTKGGKTITIESDETITEVGNIQNHLWLVSLGISDMMITFISTKGFEYVNNALYSDTGVLQETDEYIKSKITECLLNIKRTSYDDVCFAMLSSDYNIINNKSYYGSSGKDFSFAYNYGSADDLLNMKNGDVGIIINNVLQDNVDASKLNGYELHIQIQQLF